MSETERKSLVREHIDRCVELYGSPGDDGITGKRVSRDHFEQMRADLMMAVGMLAALDSNSTASAHK